jgi:hypothetical protein
MENDIFKWLYENQIPWCPLYNGQHLSGQNLRVSTPLHAESAKRIRKWRDIDPEFYDRVLRVFPEMQVQDRYWDEYDSAKVQRQYSDGFAGCRRYIDERIEDPGQKAMAEQRLKEFMRLTKESPEAYPAELLLRALCNGSIKRVIIPLNREQQEAARRRKAKEASHAV